MKKILLLLILVFSSSFLFGQDELENYSKVKFEKIIKTKGYFNATRVSYGFIPHLVEFGVSTVNGIMIKPRLGVGIGLALEFQEVAPDPLLYLKVIPVTLHAKYYWTQKPKSLYTSMDVGWGFPLSDKHFKKVTHLGGYTLRPAIGIRYATLQKHSLFLELGFRLQDLNIGSRTIFPEPNTSLTKTFSIPTEHTSISFGIIF